MKKKCNKCNVTKPIIEFYRHSKMADGYLGCCKKCSCKQVRLHRLLNDSVREYDRKRYQTPKRKEQSIQNAKQWRKRYPDKYKAQTAVGNAIRDGKLIKMSCQSCGTDNNIHAHHHDYSKPLEVMWLCAKCHLRLHHQ